MAMQKIAWNWELIEESPNGNTSVHRAKVIGGWIVWTIVQEIKLKVFNSSQVFVPDRDHLWVILQPPKEEKLRSNKLAEDFASP